MAALVLIHGRAAAGKLTVARAVEALVRYPVFHNHLVVDLLTAVFPFGSDAFVELRERFPPADLVIDTETLTATEAAAAIVAHFGLPAQLRCAR